MNILIRTDSSIQIGTGHIMRCLTLADALRERGASVEFVSRQHSGNILDLVENTHRFKVHRLPLGEAPQDRYDNAHASWLGSSWQKDALATTKVIESRQPIDWLIVDHYALDEQWEKQLQPLVSKIMAVDDMPDRRHYCDLLLDQNFSTDNSAYDSLVPGRCVQFRGPRYALLRKEFLKARQSLRQRGGDIRRIFVFFGGSDLSNESEKTLEALCLLKRPDIAVDFVIGQNNQQRSKLEQLIAPHSNIQTHFQVENIAALMAKADLAIGAAGTTTWERCCLGLPSLVITIAENQKLIASGIEEGGFAIHLGEAKAVTAELITKNIKQLLEQPEKLLDLSARSMQLVDGLGSERLAHELLSSEEA